MTSVAVEPETKVYFGQSLEEVLPQIRAELGADALIVRQREGIVGGIGGFFGRKCVEVEAQAAQGPAQHPANGPAPQRSLPPRTIVDAYDSAPEGTSEQAVFEPLDQTPAGAGAPPADSAQGEPLGVPNDLMEALLAQSSPFAATLTSVLARVETPQAAAETAEAEAPEQDPLERVWELEAEPERPAPTPPSTAPPAAWEPRLDWELPLELTPAPRASSGSSLAVRMPDAGAELAALREELLAATVPVRLVGEIIAEARDALAPFDPDTPLRELVRRTLARRIPVARARRASPRRIAVIGPAGAGRTLVAASLATAYARAGRSVTALSLEPARKAMRLAELIDEGDAGFEVAHAPDLVRRALAALPDGEVVVADAPALLDAVDPSRLGTALGLLEAFAPDEAQLVLPAGTSAAEGQAIVAALAGHKLPTRLVVSHADDQAPSGVAVGLALAHRIPVSFLGLGPEVGRLRPAEPELLGGMVLA